MSQQDHDHGIFVGGRHGIHLHGTRPVAPETTSSLSPHWSSVLPGRGQLQRSIAAHGRAIALAFVGAGCLVLLAATALIGGLGLPGLLYIPALTAVGALWLAALALHVVHGASRRALARSTEQQILQLSARMGRPLTVPDVARSLGLSLAEAEAALLGMAGNGYSSADVDLDTGELQFVIPPHHDLRP